MPPSDRKTPNPAASSGEQSPVPACIRVGPAGWSYPDWKGIVYPARRPGDFHEASYLAEFFDTIEINTSFYHPIQPAMAEHWIERVASNPSFVFTAKLWRQFTHEPKATSADEQAVRAGFDVLHRSGKLGAVLLQFPFSFHRTPENLSRLRQLFDAFQEYPLVVEVRHASWQSGEFYEFLHRRGVGFCNIDQPIIGLSVKPSERTTSAVGYIRLHGRRYDTWFSDDPAAPPAERYNYLYSEQELVPWVVRIRAVAHHADTVFVVTNNHYQGKGVVNALQLIHMLSGAKVKVPETLRDHYPELSQVANEPPQEPRLF